MKTSNLHLCLLALCCQFIHANMYAQSRKFGTGDKTTNEDLALIKKSVHHSDRDLLDLPTSYSIKQYAPEPGNQGKFGTCVAWSTTYAARTIIYAIKQNTSNVDSSKFHIFSPRYTYNISKSPADENCEQGVLITTLLDNMKKGALPGVQQETYECQDNDVAFKDKPKAAPFKIKDYTILCKNPVEKNDIIAIKKSVSENKPVVLSIKFDPSLYCVGTDGVWNLKTSCPDSKDFGAASDSITELHAICVVGYDDTKLGGAFELINSWGTEWGNKGFFWMTYDQFMQYGKYAVELMDVEPDNSAISGTIDFILLDTSKMPVNKSYIKTNGTVASSAAVADFAKYSMQHIYPGGTAFKLMFKTNSPAYIHIFSQDNLGVISSLFPYDTTVSAAINSRNQTVFFPSEYKHAKLSATPAKENICVMYSKNDVDVNELQKLISTQHISIQQAVKNKYAAKLVKPSGVNFSDQGIVFDAAVKNDALVCFFVELEHN